MPQPASARNKRASTTTAEPVGAGQVIGADVPATSAALIPAGTPLPDDPSSIYRALDAADEELIVGEIVNGTLVEKLVYEFMQGDTRVRGISYVGVNWCVQQMAARGIGAIALARDGNGDPFVKLHEGTNPDGEPVYKAIIVAKCTYPNGMITEAAGMADALRFPPKKGGNGNYTDPHAERKAVSKAQRNAKAALIDELLKAELIARVTKSQLQLVQTSRQRAEIGAGERQQTRAKAASGRAPAATGADAAIAAAGQQRLILAKFKEGGGEDLAREMKLKPDTLRKALIGWGSHAQYLLDRLPKAKVDDVVAVMADPGGTVALIRDLLVAGKTDVDTQCAQWLAGELPEFAAALQLGGGDQPTPDAPVSGEQQAMA